jgi:hypothetical protein
LTEEDAAALADDLIPEDLRDFILRHIDSIAQLEALLLLRRNSGETWTAGKAAARLYISESEATNVLEHLCSADLLSCSDGHYRFLTHPDEQRQMVERLADSYGRHLIQVTNLIHAKPRRLREFSDAFKIRKDRS